MSSNPPAQLGFGLRHHPLFPRIQTLEGLPKPHLRREPCPHLCGPHRALTLLNRVCACFSAPHTLLLGHVLACLDNCFPHGYLLFPSHVRWKHSFPTASLSERVLIRGKSLIFPHVPLSICSRLLSSSWQRLIHHGGTLSCPEHVEPADAQCGVGMCPWSQQGSDDKLFMGDSQHQWANSYIMFKFGCWPSMLSPFSTSVKCCIARLSSWDH